MPKRKASLTHIWVGAVVLPIDHRSVASAHRRGTSRTDHDQWLEILDVYCKQCRRAYADVGHQVLCPAAADDEHHHLIGGPTGERKKRDHSTHDCTMCGCSTDIAKLRRAVGVDVPMEERGGS